MLTYQLLRRLSRTFQAQGRSLPQRKCHRFDQIGFGGLSCTTGLTSHQIIFHHTTFRMGEVLNPLGTRVVEEMSSVEARQGWYTLGAEGVLPRG